jgi:hypothetical protein
MKLRAWLRFGGDAGVAGQAALVVAAWVYLCALHWHNDGLWYQGDAPRHAATGLFWRDYLADPSSDPKGYALSFYARYPAINVTSHPPLFHLLEAGLFCLFGPSPYVAKGLVLAFALAAGLYAAAWLRRWVGPGAGWGGALVLLLPGTVTWSHAVMLNVPALALGLAALYHARRWLEAPPELPAYRHLYAAAAFCLLAVGTYFTAGVVVFVIIAWVAALRRWRLLTSRRTLAVAVVATLPVLPAVPVVLRFAPTHVNWAIPEWWQLRRFDTWAYYAGEAVRLVGPALLVLAAAGAAAGLSLSRWRRETRVLLIWLGVIYVVFSCLPARDGRYVLLAVVPVVCLGMIALAAGARAVGGLVGARWVLAGTAASVLGAQAWVAAQARVPAANSFAPVAHFLAEEAPDEPFFYDGRYDGVFTFHIQANDPEYRRRVVLGRKLLYASAMIPGYRLREYVTSPEQVVEVLRTRGGCRWLAVEVGGEVEQVGPAQLLREAVRGPEFELVRSFPVDSDRGVERVDVYRLLGPVERVEEVDLPFPILGEQATYRVRPIRSRAATE